MTDHRQARILAMQSLCQLEVLHDHFMAQVDDFLAEQCRDAAVRQYARDLVREAWDRRESLDQAIQHVAANWELPRMTPVDRNIIRVAACELLHRPPVPPKVVIDEAVEIGKIFGTADSGAFINGILDAIFKKQSAGSHQPSAISLQPLAISHPPSAGSDPQGEGHEDRRPASDLPPGGTHGTI